MGFMTMASRFGGFMMNRAHGSAAYPLPKRWMATKKPTNVYYDFNNVMMALRRIAEEEQLPAGVMPETKLLKSRGDSDLIHAIRKKHGGFVHVARKLGYGKDAKSEEIQQQITARNTRRRKREVEIAKHNFY